MIRSDADDSDEAQRQLAIREAMQKIALNGLQRGGFFSEAAFYGGTCLRIFYGLPRFSEDLDFSLLDVAQKWSIEKYFEDLEREFEAAGVEIDISRKKKVQESKIESAFLKSDTSLYHISNKCLPHVRIKLEVDTRPPLGFETEYKLLLQPYSTMIRCYMPADLFAGKVHALLYRAWKKRVKGRDWFDFAWFVQKGFPLNLTHLQKRIEQSHPEDAGDLTDDGIRQRLMARIDQVDFNQAKQDVIPFIPDPHIFDIWSREYFRQIVMLMRTTD